jgi:serine/threonine protein kinase
VLFLLFVTLTPFSCSTHHHHHHRHPPTDNDYNTPTNTYIELTNQQAHRDIKPENLMCRSDSSRTDVVLVDFGLAGRVQISGALTLVDVVGTTRYSE